MFHFSLTKRTFWEFFYIFLLSFSGIPAVSNELCALDKKKGKEEQNSDIPEKLSIIFYFWRQCELKFEVDQHRSALELFLCLFGEILLWFG